MPEFPRPGTGCSTSRRAFPARRRSACPAPCARSS